MLTSLLHTLLAMWSSAKNYIKGGAALIAAFFAYDNFFNYGFTKWEERSIYEQIYEFERTHIILGDEVLDGDTRLTYRTCYAPKIPYTISFIVNGRNVGTYSIDPLEHGSVFTEGCETFTGRWIEDLVLNPGDKMLVKYNYGEYGNFESVYLKKL